MKTVRLLVLFVMWIPLACGDEGAVNDDGVVPEPANPDIVGIWRMETDVSETIDMWIEVSEEGFLDRYTMARSVTTLQYICTRSTGWSIDGERFQLNSETVDSLERAGTIEAPGIIRVIARSSGVRATGHFDGNSQRIDSFTDRFTGLSGACECVCYIELC